MVSHYGEKLSTKLQIVIAEINIKQHEKLYRRYTERTFWANRGHFQTILPTEHQLESAKLRKFYILILC